MSSPPRIELHEGDCLDVLAELPEASVDAVVTDPPYHLTSIVRRFGAPDAAEVKVPEGASGVYRRSSRGFMGQQWDGGDIAFRPETWAAVARVLKPGGYLLAFAGTRGWHRMICAIEDAGFDIRDALMWLYGSGFPKSHDVAKGIDKALGAEGALGDPKSPAHAGWIKRGAMRGDEGHEGWQSPWMADPEAVERNAREYIPGSPEAAEWQGWGTALKPAWEPITVARKPLAEGSIARQVLATGTGAMNIDRCRVPHSGGDGSWGNGRSDGSCWSPGRTNGGSEPEGRRHERGRWPANVLHDGSREVLDRLPIDEHGSVARFFYCAKADKQDRAGSDHPTVKPQALMRWLVGLVTPPRGVVLDPFAGSGATGWAASREGRSAVLIEREAEHAAHIRRRIASLDRLEEPDPESEGPAQLGLFSA